MKTQEIKTLFLNIGDILEISIVNFYYRLTKEGKQSVVEVEQNKQNEKEWIPCPTITGSYCGCNYKQEKEHRGELNIIKIRVSSPFNMGSTYRNYLTFAPSQTTGITSIKKKKANVLDQVCHTLAVEQMINEN